MAAKTEAGSARRAARRKTVEPPAVSAVAPETTIAPARGAQIEGTAEQSETSVGRRPNAPGLRCLARAHAAAAVEALAAVMRDPSATPAARVSAAGALLAWGYGKAAQSEDGRRGAQAGERIVRLVWGGDDA